MSRNQYDIGTQPNLDRVVALANVNPPKPLVLMFTASWCPACQKIGPTFDALAKANPRVLFGKIDCDQAQDLASAYKVTGMPTFVFMYKNVEKSRMAGASPDTLTAAVEKLEKETSTFQGAGHSMSGPSSAPSVGASLLGANGSGRPPGAGIPLGRGGALGGGGSSGAPLGAAPAPSGKRNNPWANPEWKPPSSTVAAPVVPVANANSGGVVPIAAGGSVNVSSGAVPVAAIANDARLVVNRDLVVQLEAMGFATVRAEKACVLTKNRGFDACLEWLLAHEGDEDIDQPLQVVGASKISKAEMQEQLAAKPEETWVSGQRGAPLGWKAGDKYDEDDANPKFPKGKVNKPIPAVLAGPLVHAPAAPIVVPSLPAVSAAPIAVPVAQVSDDAILEAQFQSQFGTQVLTREEKLAKLDQIRANYRADRASAEQRASIEREKARIESERRNTDLRRASEDREMKMAIDYKKREDQLNKERHKKIMQKIADDKASRAAEKLSASGTAAIPSTALPNVKPPGSAPAKPFTLPPR